jgi:transposase
MTGMSAPSESRQNVGGRPPKLTPALIAKAATLLREGAYERTVCDYLGIARLTWVRWKHQGEEEPDSLYGRFCNTVKMARADAELVSLRAVRHGREGWQAHAWFLERGFKDHWARTDYVTYEARRDAQRVADELGVPVERVIAESKRFAEVIA